MDVGRESISLLSDCVGIGRPAGKAGLVMYVLSDNAEHRLVHIAYLDLLRSNSEE